MASRRSVLIGLGSLVAGGGALLGTGAFTTVTAERTVNVETAGDASAFLGLAPADRDSDADGTQNEYVASPGDGTLEITLVNDDETAGNATGLNQNARTVFRNLVTVTNNGTQEVTSLELDFIGEENDNLSDSEINNIFSFTVSPTDGTSNRDTVSDDSDILTDSNSIPGALGPGSSINFGLEIDLLNNSVTEIPADSSFTLEITAETSNSA
ncbi:hypothetical protein [Halorubrum ezzemoulense]|uniref:hypothetical protein n=1 Tax=Halorubrum ezzemoulense TaxID=337243 RepID=UPI00233006B7|nr:hypothetical protein [Halorubrum ezzemoulense]MDB9233668.1 hypothetical protein [Halorubrum ezzemoulense]